MNHKVKRKLTELMLLCVEKQVHFKINTDIFLVEIFYCGLSFSSHYFGKFKDKKTMPFDKTLDELIAMVKTNKIL